MFNLYVYIFSVIKYSSCWKIIKNVIEFQEILQRKNHQNILMCLTFDKKENMEKTKVFALYFLRIELSLHVTLGNSAWQRRWEF